MRVSMLPIGEFSRATHLTVKALRHYDDVGLLEPARTDAASGYRYYSVSQIPAALLIRRFRDLDMPLDEVRRVLQAADRHERDAAIVAHLRRMEQRLEETNHAVTSLRDLLAGAASRPAVDHRDLPSVRALVTTATVEWDAAEAWLGPAFDELHRRLRDAGGEASGADGALYSAEFFETHRGPVTAFVPVGTGPGTCGIETVSVPAGRHAVTVHEGPFGEIDRAYAALGAHVAELMIVAAGPIREHYLSAAPSERTEVCWPIVGSRA